MIDFIYMAAGNSRRFGENKLLCSFEGKPLYRHSLDMLIGVVEGHPETFPGSALIVVTQYREIYDAVKELQREHPFLKAVLCTDSRLGASYTIQAGVRASSALSNKDYLCFTVSDQPFLSEETILKLAGEAVTSGAECVSACFEDIPGNPCLFRGDLADELMKLSGDQGGRRVIRQHSCRYVPVSEKRELYDIDTKEDRDEAH